MIAPFPTAIPEPRFSFLGHQIWWPVNGQQSTVSGRRRLQSAVCCLATSRVPAARSTDRRGRSGSFDSHGEGRHAVAPGIDASKQEALRFANEIGKRLDKARKDGRFDQLVLVAAPRFLGLMRGGLNRLTLGCVAHEVATSLVSLGPQAIRDRMP